MISLVVFYTKLQIIFLKHSVLFHIIIQAAGSYSFSLWCKNHQLQTFLRLWIYYNERAQFIIFTAAGVVCYRKALQHYYTLLHNDDIFWQKYIETWWHVRWIIHLKLKVYFYSELTGQEQHTQQSNTVWYTTQSLTHTVNLMV